MHGSCLRGSPWHGGLARDQGVHPCFFWWLTTGCPDIHMRDADAVRTVAKPLHDGGFEFWSLELRPQIRVDHCLSLASQPKLSLPAWRGRSEGALSRVV